MKLYCIVDRNQIETDGCDKSLAAACQKKNIEYIRLVQEDVELESLRDMQLLPGSLLYRISLTAKGRAIEAMLATLHTENITTIYYPRTILHPHQVFYELLIQMKNKLQIIPTQILDETWLKLDDPHLQQRVDALNGFPIILKSLGKSHGQGVMRIEGMAQLHDCLGNLDFTEYRSILRKYLADYHHYRIIIVEGQPLAAIEYHKPDDDFRTNASENIQVSAVDVATLDPAVTQLAKDGVAIRTSILGGVDILVEQPSGIPYLAEVNVPCYFARAEGPTGIDIAGQLLDALLRKQEASHV